MTDYLNGTSQILYATVRLTAKKDGEEIGAGTGFHFRFNEKNGRSRLAIVTNKHVIEDADALEVDCHIANGDTPSGNFVKLTLNFDPAAIFMHPSPDVDLCAIPFSNTMEHARQNGLPIFLKNVGVEVIPAVEDWLQFDALEDVIMAGCPNGIWDAYNNFPILRSGITATPLTRNYEGRPEFVVDMACYGGSSGSPIFISDKNAAGRKFYLIGILYAGPLYTNTGEVITTATSSVEIATMMHLGYAIKSSELIVLDQHIRDHYPLID